MSDDIREGIEDLSAETLDPELKGSIVDLQESTRSVFWITGGVVSLIGIVFASWLILYLTRTDSQLLQENLSQQSSVAVMVRDAHRIIQSNHVKPTELRSGIDSAINASTTQLRVGGNPRSPLLQERYDAMITALEGLLRLELEYRETASSETNERFMREALDRLGRQRIEYFDKGILEWVPLIQSAWLRHSIEQEKESIAPNELELEELRFALRTAMKEESLTSVGAAYTLGKWYRYHNDMEQASRCFHIGRRYVEGYPTTDGFIEGKRPTQLDGLWEEYVGCVESLAEIAFQNREYRLARVYLTRIFETPNSTETLLNRHRPKAPLQMSTPRIEALSQDILTLKRAIANVLDLPSFPFYDPDKTGMDWQNVVSLLTQASKETEQHPLKPLWERIPEEVQSALIASLEIGTIENVVKLEIISALNTLVRSPTYFSQVSLSDMPLSNRGKALLAQSRERLLLDDERTFMNREILDLALAEPQEFTLSDGTRLHDRLNAHQTAQLTRLYQEALDTTSSPSSELAAIRERLATIDGEFPAKVKELDKELWRQVEVQQLLLAQNERDASEQKLALQGLHEELRELEGDEGLAIDRVLTLQKKEQRRRETLEQLTQGATSAKERLESLQGERLHLTSALQNQLKEAEAQFSAFSEREGKRLEQRIHDNSALLAQVDNQINLRKKYLTLLEGLPATDGASELRRLEIEHQRLEGEMSHLREKAASLSGDEREVVDFQIAQLDGQIYQLVNAFDQLFNPLRDTVAEIAKEEEEIWNAEGLLRQTYEDIVSLVGTNNSPGSLEEKAERRRQLLLMKADDAIAAPMYDTEVRRLNEEIAEDHAKLNLHLETERLARETLHTFYPHLSTDSSLIYQDGDLSSLRDCLDQQAAFMEEYQRIWQENELLDEMFQQEKAILHNLQEVSSSLADNQNLNESQTRNLTRFVENILLAKNHLAVTKQSLRELHDGRSISGTSNAISGSGYLIDNVEMFQIEHEMGLSLGEHRVAFEERASIVKQLARDLHDKEQLEAEKLIATRERDQEAIDLLIPKAAEKEGRITLLSQKEAALNERLRLLADNYAKNLHKANAFRENIAPRMIETQTRLQFLSQKMGESDEVLRTLVSRLFRTATKLNRSITTLSVDDLNGIDEIIAHQKRELLRLEKIQRVKQKENYFKAKALYLVGRSYLEQSTLETLSELAHSHNLTDVIWPELEPRHTNLYAEFKQGSFYTRERLQSLSNADSSRVHYQTWVEHLENRALQVFQRDLPEYLDRSIANGATGWIIGRGKDKDQEVFLAHSRFLTGELFVRRSLRHIRSSRALPQDNNLARSELNKATTAFLGYLDFAKPLAFGRAENDLSSTRLGAQEFPERRRHPISRIDDAYIYLGVIAGLKGAHHEAIGHYRDLIQSAAARLPRRRALDGDEGATVMGQIDPILLETSSARYFPKLFPFYASLLSHNNGAHEALFRLAKSYQALAKEEYHQGLANSAYFFVDHDDNFSRAKTYAHRSIAYYSQLVLTGAYSPYRKGALLQRALLQKQFGSYQEARNDMVSILGSPGDQGGSWLFDEMSSKGDLPGELNPGYTYTSFELGKLHLENQNFSAAADAFLKAKEGDPDNLFVVQAKVAFSETLVATKNWLMANLLLTELVNEMRVAPEEHRKYYPLDLFVNLGKAKTELGNLAAANEVLREIHGFIPVDLVNDGELDLASPYGRSRLESDYRDAIRPLALATFARAEVLRAQRHYEPAARAFNQAETLFHMVSWKEDRVLREIRKTEFHSYQREKILQCRWEVLKTQCLERLYTTFSDYRNNLHLAKRVERKLLPMEIREQVTAALEGVNREQDQFSTLSDQLTAFYQEEWRSLPEVKERTRIQQQRELERATGSLTVLTYDALKRIRGTLIELMDATKQATPQRIANRFSKESLEDKLLNDFIPSYAQQITLTRDDRAYMLPTRSNFENLLAIPNAEQRLVTMGPALLRWAEQQMQQTGLDDLFIPVSEQARVLEEVDLYRVSLLSHVDTASRFQELKQIVTRHLDDLEQVPSRASQPEVIWQMVEIGAMTAEFQMDWEASERFHRFLLAPENQAFFLAADKGDRYRSELNLAHSLIRLSQKSLGDLIFLQDQGEKLGLQLEADQRMEEAREILKRLSVLQGDASSSITTRIRAKQILAEVGV